MGTQILTSKIQELKETAYKIQVELDEAREKISMYEKILTYVCSTERCVALMSKFREGLNLLDDQGLIDRLGEVHEKHESWNHVFTGAREQVSNLIDSIIDNDVHPDYTSPEEQEISYNELQFFREYQTVIEEIEIELEKRTKSSN